MTRSRKLVPAPILVLVAALALVLVIVTAAPALAQVGLPDKVCVYGFSKDFGALRLNSGTWNANSCQVPHIGSCRTLEGDNANAGGFFFTDGALCNGKDACDEADDLDGRFESVVDVRLRLQDPCPVRGAWEGDFRLYDEATYSIVLAAGTIRGTLGVGTHREETGPDCEGCHEARFDPDLQRWFIHSEGFIEGDVLEGTYQGCELRASFQGEFNANGDAAGPQPPNYNWGFEGKADGVLLCRCQ